MIATDGITTIANAPARRPTASERIRQARVLREAALDADRDDVAIERRLSHESQTVELGRFCAPGCETALAATDVCRVEVSRGYFTDEEGTSLRENAGYYVVFVSTTPGGEHPANIATDAVNERELKNDWDYFSVDDVFPY